jgi:hypothetical protein
VATHEIPPFGFGKVVDNECEKCKNGTRDRPVTKQSYRTNQIRLMTPFVGTRSITSGARGHKLSRPNSLFGALPIGLGQKGDLPNDELMAYSTHR